MEELRRTVARLQAEVDEMKKKPTAAHDELFDGEYQPPFRKLPSRDEEDVQIRKFFQNGLKVRVTKLHIYR